MTDTDMTEIDNWATAGKQLADKLRRRLQELEVERTRVMQELRRLEAPERVGTDARPAALPAATGARALRSEIASHILQLLAEAGPSGLRSSEIIEGLRAELGEQLERGHVLTHLSRLKKRSAIEAEGEAGVFIYRLPTRA
jgi:hypothetical protein